MSSLVQSPGCTGSTPRIGALGLAALLVAVACPAAAQDPPPPAPVEAPPAAPPAATAPPAAPPPPAPKRSARADEPTEVYLRTSDPRAILERRPLEIDLRNDLPGVDGWVPVCIAPCGVRLGRAERLRIAGSGVDPSDGFLLPPEPGPFTVHAQTGSAASQTAGLVLVLSGGALLGLGGFSLLTLQLTGATKNAEPDSVAAKMQIASITTLILSAVAFGVGAPFRFSERTSARVEPGKMARRSPAPRFVIGPGFVTF
jgi:hypothetical protein